MATKVHVIGDSSNLDIAASPLGASPELEFLSGSFRSSPEERRVCTVFLGIAGTAKVFQLRLEFTDAAFIEHSVTGKPVYRTLAGDVDIPSGTHKPVGEDIDARP